MCSKQPEDCLTLRTTEWTKRFTDDAAPCALGDASSFTDLNVQPLKHPEDRCRSATAAANTDRIDHPGPGPGIRFLDHDVRCLQVTVKEAGFCNPEDECTDLPGDIKSRCRPRITTLQVLKDGPPGHVDQFQLQDPPTVHRDDVGSIDDLGRGNAGSGQSPGPPGLARGLGQAEHVLGQQPRRHGPELRSPGALAGPLHQPDAARAILLEAGHGMIGSPTHVRSIPGTSDRVV